jgi:hypothetical protein
LTSWVRRTWRTSLATTVVADPAVLLEAAVVVTPAAVVVTPAAVVGADVVLVELELPQAAARSERATKPLRAMVRFFELFTL